ncbi:uncharacterized protein METZ01_LOCUS447202, partial [marine metagenome]
VTVETKKPPYKAVPHPAVIIASLPGGGCAVKASSRPATDTNSAFPPNDATNPDTR